MPDRLVSLLVNFLEQNNGQFSNLAKAKELHEGFSDALATELLDPSDDLIKAIFNRMHGKRITDQIKAKIKTLNAYRKLYQ